MATNLRVLLFDIETAPAKVYRWDQSQDFIPPNMIIHDTSMISWAAKWRDGAKVYSDAVLPWEAIEALDDRIVLSLADLIRKADIVVAHNVEKFDLPKVNGYVLNHRQEPLGPVKTIDTLKLARKNFGIQNSSLDYLAGYLGLGRKLKTDFELWRRIVEEGHLPSINRMLRYNRKDVVILGDVFETILPYVNGIPRLTDPTRDNEHSCPYCPSNDLQRRGIRRTNGLNYQRWQCTECLRYSRSRSRMLPRPGLMTI